MMKKILIPALFLGATAALASEKFIPGPDNKIFQKDVVTVNVPWVKDKGAKFDLNLKVHNENQNTGIIIFLSDLGCQRGDTVGSLKHTFFNTGERTIDFKPNQTKDFNMVCRTDGTSKGHFKISVAKVYDNPSLDGKTVGKVIATNLNWSQDDRSK